MRILFITATRVGDAILSTGLLHHLLQRHPGARVTVACGPAAASLFDAVPGLERTIVLQKMQFSLHWVELWAACAGRLWDVLVDLRNAPLARLLATRRAYRATRGRQNRHRVVQLAGVLGLDDNPPPPHLWTGPAHEARARELIPGEAPVLAVGPTANWIAKTWRPERFTEAIGRLTGSDGILPGARVAVFGRDDERPQALGLLESIPADRRLDLVGHLDLVEVFACLRRCHFYLGNDSGLMHLAAAAGIPTLGLFGPSPVDEYAPWGGNTATVHTAIPYPEMFPPNFDPKNTGTLMDSLSVDAVEAAARALWNRTREAAA
ncbi:MAG: glycosyltransferase family 9 protein [Hyphomicrobiales bacterium]|nr:glycosyltransferase family 9 protein [Hyphomicrobiales bacterium]